MTPAELAWSAVLGVEVLAQPNVLSRSSDVCELYVRGPTPSFIVWSLAAFRQMLRGVRWHDDAEHCRTWAAGCRCDLGDEA